MVNLNTALLTASTMQTKKNGDEPDNTANAMMEKKRTSIENNAANNLSFWEIKLETPVNKICASYIQSHKPLMIIIATDDVTWSNNAKALRRISEQCSNHQQKLCREE